MVYCFHHAAPETLPASGRSILLRTLPSARSSRPPGRAAPRISQVRLVPNPDGVIDSAVTAWDLFLGDGVADLARTPSSIIHEGPQCTVHRYRSRRQARADRSPVLLVPPLAAPATCFDLRRGCSLAEHLTALGYPTYLVDYGPISYSDRALGLEHWTEQVIPTATRAVAADAGSSVQAVGWCLGGIMTLLAVAADVLTGRSAWAPAAVGRAPTCRAGRRRRGGRGRRGRRRPRPGRRRHAPRR